MSRFKGKPVGGLPGRLPEGEALVWQGAPEWRALARHAFRLRIIAGYFGGLLALRVGAALAAGHGARFALATGLNSFMLAGSSLAIFLAIAWLMARSTTYSITSKRVVITYGMALPKSVNLPFSRIDAADLKLNADGSGDIALKLPAAARLSYLLLWPHVRAGAAGRAEPVLRCIAAPEAVAETLAEALFGTLTTGQTGRAQPVRASQPLGQAQAA